MSLTLSLFSLNSWFQVCFDLFDTKKQDFLSADDLGKITFLIFFMFLSLFSGKFVHSVFHWLFFFLGEIMRAMGFRPTEEELKDLLKEIDEDGSGEIEIGEFLYSFCF